MKIAKVLFITGLSILSSCSGFRAFDDETAINIIINEPGQVVSGIENWEGPSDCSSHAYLNKTASGFLFTIEVYDDSIQTGNEQSYMNDGIELYFDFRPPRLREKNIYEKGVFQAVLLPDPGKKEMAPIEWFPSSYETEIPGTRAYTELRDSGYVLQVSIPYSGLQRYHFWPRTKFYMDIAINDADKGERETQIMWKGKNDNWRSPHNFELVSYKEEKEKEKKPNFLLIMTDQQTINAMGASGNPYVKTPNIDALAKYGVRFTKSYCAAPESSPSKSSLLTSLMPHETGVNYNNQALDSAIKNIGEYFRENEYNTYWAGKWHLPESYPQTLRTEVPGFTLLDFTRGKAISPRGDVSDEQLADATAKFLKGRKREPFLMAVSFQNPHDISLVPTTPDAFSSPPNIKSTPPLPINHWISANEPEFMKDARIQNNYGNEVSSTADFSQEDWRNYLHHYYRMIESVDLQIGKLIEAIEQEGLDENTLIIFTSTYGNGSAAHKWAGKQSLYEESVKVPTIITWFGKTPANKIDDTHLVSGIDIMPTLMDYAGFEIPENLNGQSLKAIIENPDTIWRKYLVTELANDPGDSTKYARMITDGQYKYIRYSYGQRPEQLFKIGNIPGERINLIANVEFIHIQNRLKRELKKWQNENGDPFDFRD